jgi:hypothetical protein
VYRPTPGRRGRWLRRITSTVLHGLSTILNTAVQMYLSVRRFKARWNCTVAQHGKRPESGVFVTGPCIYSISSFRIQRKRIQWLDLRLDVNTLNARVSNTHYPFILQGFPIDGRLRHFVFLWFFRPQVFRVEAYGRNSGPGASPDKASSASIKLESRPSQSS